MFALDIPVTPSPESPVLLVQAPTSGAMVADLQPDYLLKECQETESTGKPRSAMRAVDPAYMLKNYLQNNNIRKNIDLASINTTLIEGAKHGTITTHIGNDGITFYGYDAIPDYEGRDRAVFMAEFDGKRFKIIIDLRVFKQVNEYAPVCPKPQLIQVTKPRTSLAPEQISLSFANLEGAALAQTAVSSTDAQITLDNNAAGHGWFIDYTPYLNEEFLPTSNPNEWVAKPGSEAEGKMDMLTVLLHEYGHALGLDHSADGHDFMAATLQPGVRRTLTVDEQLELMRLAGIFVTPESPSEPYAPTDPGAPLPFTRVVATRSARRAAGLDSLVPQFDTAANPKLSNPEFAGIAGWSTMGDVRFENGTATLAEGVATQTRLNQVFVVNEGDRFLSFTVANAAIGDQAYGPQK